MKRILSLVLAAAMMAAVFTGCGCMDRNVSSHPGGMITEETTRPTVMPHPTATHSTEPRETTLPTVATDPMDDMTGSSAATGETVDPRTRGRSIDRTR